MLDAVKNYLALASGVTEVTRQRAVSAARALVSSGEATAEQVTNLADDLLTTSRNNRDTVLALVRYEIDRALMRLGLATTEEIASLAERLGTLEAAVREALSFRRSRGESAQQATGSTSSADGTGSPRASKRAAKTARKSPAKRSPAKRSPAKRAPAKRAATKRSPAKTTPAKRAAAKASPTKASPTKTGTPARAAKATKATKATKSTRSGSATPAKKATKRAAKRQPSSGPRKAAGSAGNSS